MNIKRIPQFDLSGGLQNATSFLMRKGSEVVDVRNMRFGVELGAAVRRNGSERSGDIFGASGQNTPTGGYIAKFTTGNKRFVAVNNGGGTATIVRVQDSGTGAWTTLSTTIPVDSKVYFFLYMDEVYISGYTPSTGDPITPYNVDSTLNISTTRNIAHMPPCRYIQEYNGALYACNVKISGTRYKDRAYKSSGPLGAVTFVKAAQNALTYINLDSVRYIKVGDAVDIYSAGTETKIFDITVTAVDKNLNRITYTPHIGALTFTAVAATDLMTVSSTANYPTGTPVQVTSTTTLPAPLVTNTVYYVINISGTTLKLATTAALASAGTAIDITSTGTGTHTMHYNYVLADNDEIWLDGRKGKLNILWNSDYPTPEDSDWTATLPGTDSSNEITGVGKSSGRLFLFTKNSGQKFDGSNTVTYNNTVGCISHDSIKNIDDDWLIWCDAKGRVWARNESSGQQEWISRGIHRRLFKLISAANLAASNGNVNDNNYYIYLGQNDIGKGNEYLRAVYSFDDNLWTIDRLPRPALFMSNDDYSGSDKPYFYSTDGYLYIDDTGNLDYDKIIPHELTLGRTNYGGEQVKKFDAMFVYSEQAAGTVIKVAVAGGQAKTVGKLTDDEEYIKFRENGEDALDRGTSAEVSFSGASKGDPPSIQGIVMYVIPEEDIPSERRPK